MKNVGFRYLSIFSGATNIPTVAEVVNRKNSPEGGPFKVVNLSAGKGGKDIILENTILGYRL